MTLYLRESIPANVALPILQSDRSIRSQAARPGDDTFERFGEVALRAAELTRSSR
jgi:hypothetical protein